MNTVVIVQARFGSTRLPGKVLKKLGAKSVLHHVLSRCIAVKGIDAVCCAIPDTNENEVVVAEASECDVVISRGPEDDVLSRYYVAAKETNADTIIRVTSDCPLIDPNVISLVLKRFEEEGADFASNNDLKTWPHGLDCEVFSRDWLDFANSEAYEKFDREHVGPFIRNHGKVNKINIPAPIGGMEKYRWTLDTVEDFVFFDALFNKYPELETSWSYQIPHKIMRYDKEIQMLEKKTHMKVI